MHDLLIVGGGINGAGIARDAAGRGLSVMLVEQDDLAAHTSSASTKLIHGGLRYLEQRAFRLVRESLAEREVLLGIAPHIIRPMRFILPYRPGGGRPAWMIRLGLFLYDHIGGRRRLPASRGMTLKGAAEGFGLQPDIRRAFSYADCWVDDARLVVLNAMDAAERGAQIATRTRLAAVQREGAAWVAALEGAGGQQYRVHARHIVNAGGAWVNDVIGRVEGAVAPRPPRLVKGSHIIVPRLFAGDQAYLFQNPDGRVCFAIPYEGIFTMIGTTDVAVDKADAAEPSAGEIAYLCAAANRWLARPTGPADVVHSFAGIRALHDDGADRASSVTRDYRLELSDGEGPRLLSVYGGKITTYRRLAEQALARLGPHLAPHGRAWTASAPLPGGDIRDGDFSAFLADVRGRWPFLPAALAERLARAYGTRIERLLGETRVLSDLGANLGAGLSEREAAYLVDQEFARTAEDILWRRSKIGLHAPAGTSARLETLLERAGVNG